MTKLRPPAVAVKVAISDAILKHMLKKTEEGAPLQEMFPMDANNVISQAINECYDNYAESHMGNLDKELERLENAFK
tara:strand:- start:1998 stop:2228 length:231 start_codon:yes stop_codon:yes gene_type:complete